MVPEFGHRAPLAAADAAGEPDTREALQESRRRLTTLLGNLPGMAYRCRNDAAWTMEFVSEGCRPLTGYTPAELTGNRRVAFGDLILPEDRAAVWRDVQAALGERCAFEISYRIRRLDGAVRWVWERGQGVFDAAGGLEALEGFISDITARRETEQALRESEEKFAKAFRSTPQPLAITDANTGHYIEVNGAFERVSGYRRDEVIGRTSFELNIWVDPKGRDEWIALLRRDGAVRGHEIRVRSRHGEVRLMRCSTEMIELNGRECVLNVLEDITEQRQIEEALRESEERLAGAFRASPDAMAIADAETNRYFEVNEGFERLFGYSREETFGRSPAELQLLANPGDAERLRDLFAAQGRVREEEIAVRTKSGEHRVVLHSVEPIQVGGRRCLLRISRDITASKQAQETVRESEAKFATAFQASPMALTIVELSTGRFIEVNQAFERISGYTRSEAIGRTTLELGLWSATDRAAHLARVESEGGARDRVLVFRVRSGAEVIMRASAEVILLGGLRCLLTVLEDITDQRRTEEHNAALEAQLRQNQKLEALGTLAGGIAHDFNNILTAIVVNQELAQMDVNDPVEVRQRLVEIGQASSRAKELVRQILTFSRQQQHERLRQHLQTTVHEALGLVRASLPATIEIEQELSPDAPPVLADAGQVHQVVMNLCTNAAHAMRQGPGRLVVKLAARTLDEAACRDLPPLRPGIHAVLTVADTGHGMEPAVLARIFEPFFTTKGPGEGTGLGLAMVHGIVRDHDGGIFVRSQPGAGTTFEAFFPAAQEAVVEAPVFDQPIVRGRGESVLVIDDESAICAAIGAMLGKLGYRVETFCDAEEGIARFSAAPQAFDLLLTDRTMPRVTGPEVIAAAHRLRPGLPALLMSGLNSPDTVADQRAAGGYGLVAKPIDIGFLSQTVRAVLDAQPRLP